MKEVFNIGDNIFCHNLDGLDPKRRESLPLEIIPEIGKEYTVRYVHENRSILLEEIRNEVHQYGDNSGECLFPIRWFREIKTVYRVVEVEVDKKVKEKRKELIFEN